MADKLWSDQTTDERLDTLLQADEEVAAGLVQTNQAVAGLADQLRAEIAKVEAEIAKLNP